MTSKATNKARIAKHKMAGRKRPKSRPIKSKSRSGSSVSEIVSESAGKAIEKSQKSLKIGQVPGVLKWAVPGLAGATFVWAYWPVLDKLVDQWSRIADYSHGFLVIPIALAMLWVRSSDWFDSNRSDETAGGFAVVCLGMASILIAMSMRFVAAKYFFYALAGWSIPFWVAGFVLLFYGRQAFVWALPAIVFLFFMVPLPYAVETAVARPLQIASAQISCFIFQSLMLPAALEGNTILLGDYTLEVARACSGLRITLGVAALAFAFAVFFQRTWFSNLLMGIAILPIAILANSLRIVITGLLYRLGYSESFMSLGHDGAGLLMLPIAAALFLGLIWYLDRLLPQVEELDSSSLIRRQVQSG